MSLKRRFAAAVQAFKSPGLVDSAMSVRKLGDEWKSAPARDDRVLAVARAALQSAGLTKGRMLEIRAGKATQRDAFAGFDYFSLSTDNLFEENQAEPVRLADLSALPNESFDFIYSNRAFEHLEKPWQTALDVSRMLKPGGVTVHASLFSWYYHPKPIDYWRFSPQGLASLFPDMKTLHADFDQVERRRDFRGKGDSGVPVDALGGWRENIGVIFAGQKAQKPVTPKAGEARRPAGRAGKSK